MQVNTQNTISTSKTAIWCHLAHSLSMQTIIKLEVHQSKDLKQLNGNTSFNMTAAWIYCNLKWMESG